MEADQASSAQEDTSKKGTLESLSKEDLIRKCKGLLGLAQKAKKAKDEYAEENKKLKDDLAIFQTQKEADKKSLMAMKEMVEAFTDDKIKLTSQISDLKRIKAMHDEQQKSFKECQTKLENISIENEALKRQIQRLTDENEELLANLDKMEKKLEQVNTFGLQQQKDLILLEKEASKWASLQKSYVDLQNQLKEISKENEGLQIIISSLKEEKINANLSESLKNEISQLTNQNVNLQKQLQDKCDELVKQIQIYDDYEKRNRDTLIQLENAKDLERKYKSRLQTFKSKLIEVTIKLNRLTKTKEILLETVKEYSESVPKWQQELCNASKYLFSYITYLNEAKYQLETEIEKIRKSLMESESSKDFYENKLQDLMHCCKTVILEFELKSQELEKLRSCDDNMNVEAESCGIAKCCEDSTKLINLQQEFERKLQAVRIKNNKLKTCLNLEKTLREETQQRLEQSEGDKKDFQSKIEFYEKKFDELLHCCSEALNEFDVNYYDLEKNRINQNKLSKSTNTEFNDFNENIKLILQLETDLNEQKCTLDAVVSEKKELEKYLHHEKKSKENLENSFKGYKEIINNLQLSKNFFELKLNDLLKCTAKALEEFELRSERMKVTDEIKENLLELEEKTKKQNHEIELLTSEIDKLETEKKFYIDMEKDLVKCRKDIMDLKADKDISVKKKEELIEKLRASLSVRETKNADLLAEMRELNEALKGRGDVISRQQDKIKELEQEIKRINDFTSTLEQHISEKDEKINKMTDELGIREAQINTLQNQTNKQEKTIKSLSEEISSIRDKPQEQHQIETLSSSTISKAEEQTSLREVEDSLEERYQKLRALAIKLKKRVQEQSSQIANLEIEKEINCSEKNETNKKLGTLNNQVKNLQALQNANDKLQDEIDKYKSEKLTNENKIMELLEKVKLLENEITTMKQTSSNKNDSENNINEYHTEIRELKQEIEKLKRSNKELQMETETIKTQLQFKESNLAAIREANEKLKAELEKSKSAWKQSNVLSLEIEAYEKSLNTATQNLESKTQLIIDLEETIKCQEDSTKSLKTQINLLEKNLESEKAHSQELKQQIDFQHAKLRENEHEKCELQVKIQDLTYESENLKAIVDELRLQLSEIACAKDKLCFSFENEKEQLVRQVVKLENGLDGVNNQLKMTEDELEAVRVEYANYKVRAQSILRQNQSKETSKERELEEEVTNMQSTIETLNLKINSLMEAADNYEKKMDELKQDNERVQKRCKELIDILEESRVQNECLLNENKKQCLEYQESLRAHRLQIETITNCYKNHVQDLESKHINEIEDLKKRCTSANDGTPLTRVGPFGNSKVTDEQKIDLILMEREDAEGSETASIPKRQSISKSKHDLIPLDELLNSSLDDRDIERSDSPTHELRFAREKLQVQESRIRHLTSLLAETEQDLAKLTQMNEVLKGEVRRHERAVEREQHIHNSEYLKNVILKFLTLNSGDERTRLVPVLNTILKLSPEETQAIQNVAKGSEMIQRSWGSYLPIWSNHQ